MATNMGGDHAERGPGEPEGRDSDDALLMRMDAAIRALPLPAPATRDIERSST